MTGAGAAPGAHRRWRIAALIFLAAAASIAITARDPGLTWDESIYYGRAWGYLQWISHAGDPQAFRPEAMVQVWFSPADHPPLGCLWTALSLWLFGGTLDIITAARLGAAVLFGLVAAVLYLWVAGRRGGGAGALAVLAFVLMPRLFAHGHFANLEMITVLFWLATVVAFERAMTCRTWSVLCGLCFGLALLTKINALFLPLVLAPWGLLFHGRKAVPALLAMAVLGPLLFFAGWPILWLYPVDGVYYYLANKGVLLPWHHATDGLANYMRRPPVRTTVPAYYLGEAYRERFAPWHYPFVVLLATTPLLVLLAAGSAVRAFLKGLRERWRGRAHEALVLWSFAVPVLLLALPNVPKYDGIRLMLPAYPFLAALAGVGAWQAWEWMRGRLSRPARAALAAGALLWLLLPVALFHPYQLAYYGELAGGPWGAKRLGFETTYWGDSFDGKAVEYLNAHVPENGRVALVAVGDFVWRIYQQVNGEVRRDIREGDFSRDEWDYLVVVPRQGWFNDPEREFVATHTPVWTSGLRPFGKPEVLLIYRKP